jgi:tetratricopeptide (TPR) repeat protein/transcriptional regulator with XRE-family HTH domain
VTFGELLRQLRTAADLTQEELAAAAGISPRSVSDLERGINLTARKDTTRLLADALGLAGETRVEFEAVARGRAAASTAGGVAGATRTLPRDITSFTGREPELRKLVEAVTGSGCVIGIHTIGGMAGVGKTAFAVHAAHALASRFPDGQIFLPLHGHTPGQRPVDPADALASLLLTAGIPAAQIPPGLEARMAIWRDRLAGKQLLLLLDDAADSEQVRPLLPGTAGCLVLVTSRRHLTALEDARTISLDILPPGEAAELLVRLAARPDLRAGDGAIAEIARLCGYLPLAVGMMARQLHHHPAWASADLAADLAAARDRLEMMTTENLSVTAAFDLSYQDLTYAQQQMFRRLGLHPGTDIEAFAAAALDGTDMRVARRCLDALYGQYLLTEPTRGRYHFHDLIREHARSLALADALDETNAAIGRLLDYYLYSTQAASRHLPWQFSRPESASIVPAPADTPDFPTREDAVAWLNAERLNLDAAARYAAIADRSAHAAGIAAAMGEYMYREGYWDQARSLHEIARGSAHRAADRLAEAEALRDLGRIQRWSGEHQTAVTNFTHALDLYRDIGDRPGEAAALALLGTALYMIDDYHAAKTRLGQALALYQELRDRGGEAGVLSGLGVVAALTGNLAASEALHRQAVGLYRILGDPAGEAQALIDLGAVESGSMNYQAASVSLTRALKLSRELGNRPREARALMNLGVLEYETGKHHTAVATLTQALERCNELGMRAGQADTRRYLGLAKEAIGDHHSAISNLNEALKTYREVDDRAGEVEALTSLGDVFLKFATPASARNHYEHAVMIATAITAPLLEATALVGIGQAYLRENQVSQAAEPLRRALAIYRQLESPLAHQVETTLHDRGIPAASG